MPGETAIAEMTDEQFRRHTLSVLNRELGLAGYARFLRSSVLAKETTLRNAANGKPV